MQIRQLHQFNEIPTAATTLYVGISKGPPEPGSLIVVESLIWNEPSPEVMVLREPREHRRLLQPGTF